MLVRPAVHSRVAVAGIAGFAVAAVVTGLITPGYDVRREAISALAALDSPDAWVMILGFCSAAVGLVAAGLALWQGSTRSTRIGAALVMLAGALIGVAGFAREDCSDQLTTCKDYGEAVHASGSYWLHGIGSLLAFVLLIVAFFLLGRTSRIVGVACLAGLALLVTTPSFVVDSYGLVQRVFVAVLFGWPVLAGLLAARAGVVARPGTTGDTSVHFATR
jgi:hypothetical membrane protein